MSPTRTGLIIRGCIDVLDDPAAVAEQRRVNWLAFGFGARNRHHVRRYYEGEKITLPAGEAERFAKAGLLVLIPVEK